MNLYDPHEMIGSRRSADIFHNKERARIRCHIVLAVTDIGVISLSFLLANLIYLGSPWVSHGITILMVLLPIYLWSGLIGRTYTGYILRYPRIGAARAVQTFAVAAAVVLAIAYTFKVGAVFSRGVFWTGSLLATGLLLAVRLIVGEALLRGLGGSPFSAVVIDDGMNWSSERGNLVLTVDDIRFDPETENPLEFHRLAKLVAHADRVLIACPEGRRATWAKVLKCMAVDGEILLPLTDPIGAISAGHYFGRHTLVVSAGPLHLRDRVLKRVFDIVVSSLALILLSPIFLVTAIAIRLESPGPVLFRQQRIGRDNTLFTMFKFRSMHQEQCDATASVLTDRADTRVTRVGRFIRSNSLDELPQFDQRAARRHEHGRPASPCLVRASRRAALLGDRRSVSPSSCGQARHHRPRTDPRLSRGDRLCQRPDQPTGIRSRIPERVVART